MSLRQMAGDGSIRQKPNGRWEGRFTYPDPIPGETKRKSVSGGSRAAVRARMREGMRRAEEGQAVTDSKQTVAAWVEHWCATTLEASPRRETTKAKLRTLLTRHVVGSTLGGMALDKMRPSHVDGFVLELRATTRWVGGEPVRALADSSVRSIFAGLRMCLDDAVRDGLIARNPLIQVDRPKVEANESRYLADGELPRLLAACQEMDALRAEHGGYRTRNHALFALIAATGVRKGEALALRWEDVDWTRGTITVRGTLTRGKAGLEVTATKTAKSRRTIPLDAGVLPLLKAHRKAQLEARLHAGSVWVDTGHVFTTATGAPMDPRSALRALTTAAARAGLEGVTVHSLRHTAAVTMLEAGVDPRTVADHLGHSDTRFMLAVYAHVKASMQQRAADALGAAIGL